MSNSTGATLVSVYGERDLSDEEFYALTDRLSDAGEALPDCLCAGKGVRKRSDNSSCEPTICSIFAPAFDRALIFLDESLVMRVNESKVSELQAKGVVGGLHDFQRYLDQRIHLPPDRQQWPDLEQIRAANRARGIG